MTQPAHILSMRDLRIEVEGAAQPRSVLEDFSLDVPKGRTVALVGESGCGKTLAALAILGLLPGGVRVTKGEIRFGGEDLLAMEEADLRKIRGDRIGMVFQEPSTSLNPLMPVGKQIGETLRVHRGLERRIVHEQVVSLMEMVGIPDSRRRFRSYPHQLSGGVRQRVVIAMALACRPDLLLADEPTTSLDATIQAQILDLLSRLIGDLRMSVLLISHDLGVVASLADRVAILHGGSVIEEGSVKEVLKTPAHPYTISLMSGKRHLAHPLGRGRVSNLEVDGVSTGCPLADTCDSASDVCRMEPPPVHRVETGHTVRCHKPGARG